MAQLLENVPFLTQLLSAAHPGSFPSRGRSRFAPQQGKTTILAEESSLNLYHTPSD